MSSLLVTINRPSALMSAVPMLPSCPRSRLTTRPESVSTRTRIIVPAHRQQAAARDEGDALHWRRRDDPDRRAPGKGAHVDDADRAILLADRELAPVGAHGVARIELVPRRCVKPAADATRAGKIPHHRAAVRARRVERRAVVRYGEPGHGARVPRQRLGDLGAANVPGVYGAVGVSGDHGAAVGRECDALDRLVTRPGREAERAGAKVQQAQRAVLAGDGEPALVCAQFQLGGVVEANRQPPHDTAARGVAHDRLLRSRNHHAAAVARERDRASHEAPARRDVAVADRQRSARAAARSCVEAVKEPRPIRVLLGPEEARVCGRPTSTASGRPLRRRDLEVRDRAAAARVQHRDTRLGLGVVSGRQTPAVRAVGQLERGDRETGVVARTQIDDCPLAPCARVVEVELAVPVADGERLPVGAERDVITRSGLITPIAAGLLTARRAGSRASGRCRRARRPGGRAGARGRARSRRARARRAAARRRRAPGRAPCRADRARQGPRRPRATSSVATPASDRAQPTRGALAAAPCSRRGTPARSRSDRRRGRVPSRARAASRAPRYSSPGSRPPASQSRAAVASWWCRRRPCASSSSQPRRRGHSRSSASCATSTVPSLSVSSRSSASTARRRRRLRSPASSRKRDAAAHDRAALALAGEPQEDPRARSPAARGQAARTRPRPGARPRRGRRRSARRRAAQAPPVAPLPELEQRGREQRQRAGLALDVGDAARR